MIESSKQAIESLCPDVDREVIRDFFARLDEDYFETFTPEEISTHIRMSCELDNRHPVLARVDSRGGGQFDIVIVGFDYLSEFSVFCGLLSAFGLDIRDGNIYSFSRHAAAGEMPEGRPSRHYQRSRSRPSARKIVDVFRVSIKQGEAFDEPRQREFEQELQIFGGLLAAGSIEQARERLNRFLTERIERMNEELSGLSSPVEITFDNHSSADWTVMQVVSQDVFAFLYAISNALSMRGIYIHKVKIRSSGNAARDEFFIADRWGKKIEEPQEQQTLRMAVEMIKQFTRYLPEAPDPAKAMRHFDQFLDKLAEEQFPEHLIEFLAERQGMNTLAHVLGSSDYLWDDFLGIHFRDLLPALEDSSRIGMKPGFQALLAQLAGQLDTAESFEAKKRALNRFKDAQLFLIDIKHLLEPEVTLEDFSQAVTDLAEVVVSEAGRVCFNELSSQRGVPRHADGSPCPYAICGLGKFGGREMGYASDLELLFVYDAGSPAANAAVAAFFDLHVRYVDEFIEARRKGIFRIDLRLRPHGDAGSFASSFDQLTSYYSASEGQAAPFERQALIKLRRVAGNEELGRRVEAHRDTFTYSDVAWDWNNAMHLRRRQMRELVKAPAINVKYSAGGIVDIEYAVQYLQLLNGREHPEVRVPNTLQALDRLRRLQIVSERDFRVLNEGYLFLRKLIDALRIVRGDASDLVLPDESSDEFKSLARRLGYRERDRRQGAERLATDIREWMKKVHAYFEGRFSAG